MSNNIEAWACAVSNNVTPLSIDEAKSIDSESEEFYALAEKIVEPPMSEEDSEQYGEFINNNIENWAQWIRSTVGPAWGTIADLVAVEGY